MHHSDHGAQCISLVYTTRVGEFGMLPSTGTVGDSYDNAMAESADGAYKTELVWRRKPFQDLRGLELATFRWVSWRGLEASAPVLGLQDTGTDRNRVSCKPSGASRPTIRAEQKSGHITVVSSRLKRCPIVLATPTSLSLIFSRIIVMPCLEPSAKCAKMSFLLSILKNI